MKPGIYLIVQFNWPTPIEPEHAQAARALHDAVTEADWITEAVAASGGLGGTQSSIWVFHLENYTALDRLFRNYEDPVHQAYAACFHNMIDLTEVIREEVLFA